MTAERPADTPWHGRLDPEPDSLRWHQCTRPLTNGVAPGIALVGFACDEGVRRNQGRIGAAAGPAAIRGALAGLAWHRAGPAYDAGDIDCADGDRARIGQAFNDMVARGELTAPIVIGRDHLDSGSVASPNRETEGLLDGSDAVFDWPLLNALLNTASGATWVSFHHGGGVGMGYSQHAGMVVVCDGTLQAHARLGRVLRNDPGTGVMRHADAGYAAAKQCAHENGLELPML
jgi:hypothetical protein